MCKRVHLIEIFFALLNDWYNLSTLTWHGFSLICLIIPVSISVDWKNPASFTPAALVRKRSILFSGTGRIMKVLSASPQSKCFLT